MFKKIGAFAAVALLATGVSACSGVSTASSQGGAGIFRRLIALANAY